MYNLSNIILIALFVFLKGNFLFSEESKDSTSEEIILFEPIKKHGSLFLLNNEAHQFINKSEIQENDYLDFADILIQETNFYPLHLSSLGLSNNVSFAGGFNNQFSFNGVNLSNPISFNTNLSQYSPEYAENIEIYTGMMASIFSDNSTSTLINTPEIIYNTNKPFFRFWGADAGEDYLSLDGIFAQNIAPNLSFNFGFRSVTGEGVYNNDEVRSRSLRSGLRWNFEENQNLSLTWMHNNHYLDEYGGISINSIDENNAFTDDPIEAISRFEDNSKRDIRNDFIANYSYLSSDTLNSVSAQLYYLENFTYDFKNDVLHSSTIFNDRITYYSKKYGTNVSLERKINNLFVKTKLDIHGNFIENNYYTNYDDNYSNWNYSVLFFGNYKLKDFLFSGGYRKSYFNSRSLNNYGFKIDFNINKSNNLIFDYSSSQILPIIPFSSLNIENNNLMYLRYVNRRLNHQFDIDFYYRNISNLISYSINESNLIAENINNDNSYIGGNLNFKFRWLKGSKSFDYEVFSILKTNVNINSDESQVRLPLLHSFLDTYISIPRGRSRADIGFRVSYLTENSGLTQFPDLNIYLDNNFTNDNGLARNEAYARLRLGHAYLKISLINFLNQNYYYVPMYNSLPSNFRVTFNWTFS